LRIILSAGEKKKLRASPLEISKRISLRFNDHGQPLPDSFEELDSQEEENRLLRVPEFLRGVDLSQIYYAI